MLLDCLDAMRFMILENRVYARAASVVRAGCAAGRCAGAHGHLDIKHPVMVLLLSYWQLQYDSQLNCCRVRTTGLVRAGCAAVRAGCAAVRTATWIELHIDD
jgi:hypothetical protein